MRAGLIRSGLLVLAALLVVAAPVAAAGDTPPPARELVQQARERWQMYGDANGALKLFNQAVEAAPDDMGVRLARGDFFALVAEAAVADQQEALRQAAREDYAAVAEADPESIAAGVARDGLARIDGRQWFPAPEVECPDEAWEAFSSAEKLFGSGRFDEALSFYATAAEKCPGHSTIWMSYADAFYAGGRYERAEATFRKALEANPWDRSAHRFLADTEARLGKLDEGLRQAALAVVSDPGYEAAWAAFRGFSRGTGRAYLRVYGDRAVVTAEAPGPDGQQKITIQLPISGDDAEAEGEEEAAVDENAPADDAVLWVMYGSLKAMRLVPVDQEEGAAPEPLSPFEIEREAVAGTLDDFTPGPEAPFWSMMARARAAGRLDEAVYLHLLDETLVPGYVAYREAHADRLVDYLLQVIAPAGKSTE